jgi:hypothetical protein
LDNGGLSISLQDHGLITAGHVISCAEYLDVLPIESSVMEECEHMATLVYTQETVTISPAVVPIICGWQIWFAACVLGASYSGSLSCIGHVELEDSVLEKFHGNFQRRVLNKLGRSVSNTTIVRLYFRSGYPAEVIFLEFE